ncbi:MAG: ArsR/SmtB family transcription factor [Methanohalobium sp.]|uniref:ArsR/SmtB family transcription factor n=1 Tax=Methanohalobium sp. TaxID=2837493 RepID=UPI00397AF824
MTSKQNVTFFGSYSISNESLDKVHAVMFEDVDDIVYLFKVLSDPIRLKILKALEIQELCVCVLVEITDYKYSALSYHLKLLKDENLVSSRRDKSFQTYYLTDFGHELLKSIDKEFRDL